MMLKYLKTVAELFIRRTHNISVIGSFAFGLLLSPYLVPISVSAQTMAPSTDPQPKSLLYVTSSKTSLDSLRAHVSSVDIVAPQTYASKPDGTLLGVPNSEIINIARSVGAELMPLVVNQNFSQEGMHELLINDAAQTKLINSLIAEGKARGYVGFQYDFEHMIASDENLYSAFVAKSVPLFHAAGLRLSVAVAPKHSDVAADYGGGSWQNWTGAFDYTSLGNSADFLSVMAYDDSKSVGPAASEPWVESVLNYALARVAPQKISLGIAFYGWARNNKTGLLDHIVTYPKVAILFSSNTPIIAQGWSDSLGSSFVTYKRGGKLLTAWYEDQHSFQQKLALVNTNHLLGFSAWAIGQEDPADWDALVAMRAIGGDLAFNNH